MFSWAYPTNIFFGSIFRFPILLEYEQKLSEKWWKKSPTLAKLHCTRPEGRIEGIIMEKIQFFQFFWTFLENYHYRCRNCILLVQRIFSVELLLKKKCFLKKISWLRPNFSENSANFFWQCCQNCILRVQENLFNKQFVSKTYLVFWDPSTMNKNFRQVGKKIIGKLGETALCMSRKTYWGKWNVSRKNFYLKIPSYILRAVFGYLV